MIPSPQFIINTKSPEKKSPISKTFRSTSEIAVYHHHHRITITSPENHHLSFSHLPLDPPWHWESRSNAAPAPSRSGSSGCALGFLGMENSVVLVVFLTGKVWKLSFNGFWCIWKLSFNGFCSIRWKLTNSRSNMEN